MFADLEFIGILDTYSLLGRRVFVFWTPSVHTEVMHLKTCGVPTRSRGDPFGRELLAPPRLPRSGCLVPVQNGFVGEHHAVLAGFKGCGDDHHLHM